MHSQHISIPIPSVIEAYNRNMGGTDRINQNVNVYRISIRGKKWRWWCLFTWLFDVSVQNAWRLVRNSGTDIDHLSFRREIDMSYLRRYKLEPKNNREKTIVQTGRS